MPALGLSGIVGVAGRRSPLRSGGGVRRSDGFAGTPCGLVIRFGALGGGGCCSTGLGVPDGFFSGAGGAPAPG